jgi:hypothetical protein
VRRDPVAERARVHHVDAQVAERVAREAVEQVERSERLRLGGLHDRAVQLAVRVAVEAIAKHGHDHHHPGNPARGEQGAQHRELRLERLFLLANGLRIEPALERVLGADEVAARLELGQPVLDPREEPRAVDQPLAHAPEDAAAALAALLHETELVGEDALEVVEAEQHHHQVGLERERLCAERLDLLLEVVARHPEVQHLDAAGAGHAGQQRLQLPREAALVGDPVAERDRVAEECDAPHAGGLLARRLRAAQPQIVDAVLDLGARDAPRPQLEAQPRIVAAPHRRAIDLDGAHGDVRHSEAGFEDPERQYQTARRQGERADARARQSHHGS